MARGRHTHRRHVGAIATIVVAVAGVVLLVFGGVAYAAYRYEMGHADRILPGVTIAGVDVGGMTRAEATQKVGALVRDDLRGQLTVTVGEDHWREGYVTDTHEDIVRRWQADNAEPSNEA